MTMLALTMKVTPTELNPHTAKMQDPVSAYTENVKKMAFPKSMMTTPTALKYHAAKVQDTERDCTEKVQETAFPNEQHPTTLTALS